MQERIVRLISSMQHDTTIIKDYLDVAIREDAAL